MLFYSVKFWALLALFLLLYYLLPQKFKKVPILAFNAIFYISFGVKPALLVGASTIAVYVIGRCISKFRCKKVLLIIAIFLTVGLLAVLKYSNFMIGTINSITSLMGNGLAVHTFSMLLPIGLSFYTFQALGYLIDVYRGKYEAEKNYLNLVVFLTFFPTILSGPILRYNDFKPQFDKKITFNYNTSRDGLLLFGFGLFQKLVVADRIGILVDAAYNNYMSYKGFLVVIVAVFYSLQIYFDFAGYSSMAIGLAKIMNISIKENFNTPYFSQSIAEFWRRWHISLSSWLKDYVYIPLGGNRKGKLRKLLNILLVFLVSGIWHGADWSFVVWGGIHGVYQIIQNLDEPVKVKIAGFLKIDLSRRAIKVTSMAWNFLLVSYAWIFFRADSIGQAVRFISNTFKSFNLWIFFDGSMYSLGLSQPELHVLMVSLLVMFICDVYKYRGKDVIKAVNGQQTVFRWLVYLVLIFAILVYGIYGVNYNANNFIYFNF